MNPAIVLRQLAMGEPLTEEALPWLESGLREWMKNGTQLETTLGLKSAALKARNNALFRAAYLQRAGRVISDNKLAGELSLRIKRIEPLRAIRSQNPVDTALYEYLNCGIRAVTCKKRIFELLQGQNN